MAFNRPFIRVGRTNQVMSPDQQRARLVGEATHWSEERDRPTFQPIFRAVTSTETAFEPDFKLKHVSGESIRNIEWHFRGPRFQMEWRQVTGYDLENKTITGKFDLTVDPIEDDLVQLNEMAIEIRFFWRGLFRYELHRWPITRKEYPAKVLWDIEGEILPPKYWDDQPKSADQDKTETKSVETMFAKLQKLLPDLISEMKADLADNPLSREFVLLEKKWSYGAAGNQLAYYFDDHPELENKIRILQNYNLINDITCSSVARYVMTEEFAAFLTD